MLIIKQVREWEEVGMGTGPGMLVKFRNDTGLVKAKHSCSDDQIANRLQLSALGLLLPNPTSLASVRVTDQERAGDRTGTQSQRVGKTYGQSRLEIIRKWKNAGCLFWIYVYRCVALHQSAMKRIGCSLVEVLPLLFCGCWCLQLEHKVRNKRPLFRLSLQLGCLKPNLTCASQAFAAWYISCSGP